MTNKKVGDIIECKLWLSEDEHIRTLWKFEIVKIARKNTYLKLISKNKKCEIYVIKNDDISEYPLAKKYYREI